MRETTATVDDIAIQAAKTKLSDLPNREGYAQAMAPVATTSRTQQRVLLATAALFAALVYAVWRQIDHGVLRYILAIVLAGLGLFVLAAALGSGPVPAPTAYGAAVIAKATRDKQVDVITLLTDKGVQRELTTTNEIHDALRVGDVGVAHEHDNKLVGFVRL